jgi:hypothetical protein
MTPHHWKMVQQGGADHLMIEAVEVEISSSTSSKNGVSSLPAAARSLRLPHPVHRLRRDGFANQPQRLMSTASGSEAITSAQLSSARHHELLPTHFKSGTRNHLKIAIRGSGSSSHLTAPIAGAPAPGGRVRMPATYPKCSISSSVRTRTFRAGCCPGGRTTNIPAVGGG